MTKGKVCRSEQAWVLDNFIRRWFHNPTAILEGLVKEGMTVLDIGCGSGVFTLEMAKLVGKSGKVIAADLQEKMLEMLQKKIKGKEIENIIVTHKCSENNIGLSEQVDFALAFYMVHEVPDKNAFFQQLNSIIKPEGKFLIIEPMIHVSKQGFEKAIEMAKETDFSHVEDRKVFFSMASVLVKNKSK